MILAEYLVERSKRIHLWTICLAPAVCRTQWEAHGIQAGYGSQWKSQACGTSWEKWAKGNRIASEVPQTGIINRDKRKYSKPFYIAEFMNPFDVLEKTIVSGLDSCMYKTKTRLLWWFNFSQKDSWKGLSWRVWSLFCLSLTKVALYISLLSFLLPKMLVKKKTKTYKHVHKNPHTGVYTALFIIAQTQKQPGCPSVGEGKSKPWSSMRCSIIPHWKEMSHQAIESHGRCSRGSI